MQLVRMLLPAVPNDLLSSFHRLQYALDLRQERAASTRRGRSGAAALEQLSTQSALDGSDLAAHRGLGHEQMLGGAGEAAVRGDSGYSPEMSGVHGVGTPLSRRSLMHHPHSACGVSAQGGDAAARRAAGAAGVLPRPAAAAGEESLRESGGPGVPGA